MPKRRGERFEADLGCYINPIPMGCLSCPIPECIFDDPKVAMRYRTYLHDRAVMESWKPGMKAGEVAKLWKITNRTVWRIKLRYQTLLTQSTGT